MSESRRRDPSWPQLLLHLQERVVSMTSPAEGAVLLERLAEVVSAVQLPCRAILYRIDPTLGEEVSWRELIPGCSWAPLVAGPGRDHIVDLWRRRVPLMVPAGVVAAPLTGREDGALGALLELPYGLGVVGLYGTHQGRDLTPHLGLAAQLAAFASALQHRYAALEEQQSRDRQLRHLQRRQLAGQLLADVADALAAPIARVAGETEVLLALCLEEPVRSHLAAIGAAAEGLNEQRERLLDFLRDRSAEKTTFSLNRLVEELAAVLRRPLRHDSIELRLDLGPNLPWVHGDAGQLRQVLLNLVQNSRDALRAGPRHGVIAIRTRTRRHRLLVEVEDNGPGIPEAIRVRVFEPFFTTHEAGQAAGLGLSVAADIAREHGGELRCEPRTLGACLALDLPVPHAGLATPN
jgi:signal transduction histidine kinase